jgi:hypothetical protein
MNLEEKIYQFGDHVFRQKHELKCVLARETKDYETDGVSDGISDDFGFGKHPFKAYKIGINHTIQDDEGDLKRYNWAVLANQLLVKGKQQVFFSMVDNNYTAGDPIITYNYGHFSKYDPEYVTRSKKMKYDLKLDTPVFFDCTSTVKYLDDNAVMAAPNLYNSGKTWTTGFTWSNLPPYQTLASMTPLQIVNLFGSKIEHGKGKLYLEDQFFFQSTWIPPTFTGSSDFSKSIPTADFYNGINGGYQTSFSLANLPLNGSLDNYCYILNIDKILNPGEWLEVINEKNLTGLRFQNISSTPIYGLLYYNFQNKNVYDSTGKKLNQDYSAVNVSVTIPDQALDYLYFDTTINSTTLYYPSLRINSSTNTAVNIKLKNQRMFI